MNGQRVIRMDEASYMEMCDSYGGYCTSCGDEAYGVEPDARSYICDTCGEPSVFGIEELLIMGQVEFGPDSSED